MIEGIKTKKIVVYEDERGDFRELLRNNENMMSTFSQISIGKTQPGVIKAFHWHRFQDDIFYVSKGNIKLVLYDARKDSSTKGETQVFLLGESYEPQVIFIPRGVLHGYKVLGNKTAEVLYTMNNVYNPDDPDEERVPYNDSEIKFDWRDKVLIIGGDGFLGEQLMKDFSEEYNVVGTYFLKKQENLLFLDIKDPENIKKILDSEKPDFIIVTSAKTNVEACETDPEDAKKINIIGLKNIIDYLKCNQKIVFYSSDAIFDGIEERYLEEDLPNPINIYGRTKLEGEKMIKEFPNHLIIRTSRLYGVEGEKFINQMINTLREGKEIKVPSNTPGNLTFLEDISRATLDLIKKGKSGLYHIAGDIYSLDQAAFKIADFFGFDKSLITPVNKDYFNDKVKRPSSPLSTIKAEKEGIKMSNFEEGLEKIKKHKIDFINLASASGKYKEVKECRICGSKNLVSFLNLGNMPLANRFLQENEVLNEEKFPLNVLLCLDCYLSQLSVVVDPEVLFRDYAYRSSISNFFQKHCRELAEELNQEFLKEGNLIVDIASNDGTLLKPFKEKRNKVLGIEPALNMAKIANEIGIETIPEFWNKELAEKVARQYGKAEIITAFNVFAHVHDINSFVEGVKILLSEKGYFIVEFPHILDLLRKVEFDTIYHEHLSYLSLKPIKTLFESHGLRIAKVKKFDIHGGSLRLYVEHESQNRSDGSIEKFIEEEENNGPYNIQTYIKFVKEVERIKKELVVKIKDLKEQGKTISGFGASAKGNTLLNYLGINSKMIDYLFDDTPEKQNKLAAGVHIPVISPRLLLEKKPDYLLLLAWNFAEEIMLKTKDYKNQGGKYIIPLPYLKII